MSRITVCGAGYVGLTTGACFADLGNEVTVLDIEPTRIASLRRHQLHFYEQGLQEMVERNSRAGRLTFTTSYEAAIPGRDFVFIAVATPESESGEADLRYVAACARAIAENMDGPLVVVNKSTVPIGSGDFVSARIREHNTTFEATVVSNPEFLREGSALLDFMHPDRVVIGSHDPVAAENVARLYEPLGAPILRYDIYTAEMVKYAANAFLATRISFVNEIARICEQVNADAKLVAEGIGMDKRIGPAFLDAGIGYGGSCFPKDVRALAAIAERYEYHPELLHAVMDINRDQRRLAVSKVRECLGTLRGQNVALLGLSFKPNTDDMRQAPAIDIANELMAQGAAVSAYDPVAMVKAKELLPGVAFRRSPYSAVRGADALILVTEWNEFRQLDMTRVKKSMQRPVLVDGRNIYDPSEMKRLGFVYRGIGRN